MNLSKTGSLSFVFRSAVFLILVCSCSASLDVKNDPDQSRLIGWWVDTTSTSPTSKYINLLRFSENGTFNNRIESYEISPSDQRSSELSSWMEYSGNYIASKGKLYIVSRQESSWSLPTTNPVNTIIRDSNLYEDCSFSISNDTLKLEYITYPADAPVRTNKSLIRIDPTLLYSTKKP